MNDSVGTEEDVAFQIILHAGNAKSYIMEAVKSFDRSQQEAYKELMEKAQEELTLAHNAQTEAVRKTLLDSSHNVSMIMIHAQDHIMNCITFFDVVNCLISKVKE